MDNQKKFRQDSYLLFGVMLLVCKSGYGQSLGMIGLPLLSILLILAKKKFGNEVTFVIAIAASIFSAVCNRMTFEELTVGIMKPWNMYIGLETSPIDTLILATGYFIVSWIIFDNLFGPGVALNRNLKMKTTRTKHISFVGFYNTSWLLWLFVDFVISIFYYKSMNKLMMIILTLSATYMVWQIFGQNYWTNLGQLKWLERVGTRLGFHQIKQLGEQRMFVLEICLLIRLFMYLNESQHIVAMALFLKWTTSPEKMMTVILGISTFNLPLVAVGLLEKRPITGTLPPLER